MVEFEGVSFEFDVTDADTFDAISDFEKNWKAALEKLKTAPSGDAIREVNGCIKDLLDRSCEGDIHGKIFASNHCGNVNSFNFCHLFLLLLPFFVVAL